MLRYIINRVLFFIPTLFLISLLAFGLSRLAPGDPVEGFCATQGRELPEDEYLRCARIYNLDKPDFYFSLTSAAFPDTLYRVFPKYRQEMLSKLIAQYGNWEQIRNYELAVRAIDQQLKQSLDSIGRQVKIDIRKQIKLLKTAYRKPTISGAFKKIDRIIEKDSLAGIYFSTHLTTLNERFQAIEDQATPAKNYLPAVHWYGLDNQYHFWLGGFLRGDLGISYIDGRSVATKIKEGVQWTATLNLISIFISFLIAIPLGVFSAIRKDSLADRVLTTSLFGLYSLPRFWIATLLVVFFTTSYYSEWLDWFPTPGLEDLPVDMPFLQQVWANLGNLVLPIFCLTYGSWAFITRQMRGGMLEALKQGYIRTARAKGLPENKVVWKHAFRNALFPIITIIGALFPAAIAGSVVIEMIFDIPGLGLKILQAIPARDWPMVFSVLMFSAVLTMIGILVSDILYAVVDPRISYSSKKSYSEKK
jgi:peptide/nickel transport system permease protein